MSYAPSGVKQCPTCKGTGVVVKLKTEKLFGNYGKNCSICKGKCIGHGDY